MRCCSSNRLVVGVIVGCHLIRSCLSSSKCELYLAESSIPNAGLGIYTAVKRRKDETIGRGDVCIPLLDLQWHGYDFETEFVNPFSHYVWDGESMGMGSEVHTPYETVDAFCPGLDAAVNFNPALVNVNQAVPKYVNNVHRWEAPEAAGSFTPYHNGSSIITHDIPAGGEILKSYGNEWFDYRKEIFGSHQPVGINFQTAQKLLYKFYRILQPTTTKTSFNNKKHENDIKDSSSAKDLYSLMLDMRTIFATEEQPVSLYALPSDWSLAVQAMTTGRNHGMRTIHQPNATRSIDWLEQHGTCMDHIEPQPSTLPNAGQGAFATRPLPANTIITSSPVIVIANQSVLDLHKIEPGATRYERKGKIGEQLVKNYCLGHANTDVLLCPYGGGVNYINHNQSLANVRLQWPHDGYLNHHQAKWLAQPVSSQKMAGNMRLDVQYVATRDIQEGEELFFDYGDDWELAWWRQKEKTVVKNPPEEYQRYFSAAYWNNYFDFDDTLWTEEEQKDPESASQTNLQLRCHTEITRLKRSAFHKLKWHGKNETSADYGHPCKVVARSIDSKGKLRYKVVMRVMQDLATGEEKDVNASNVPRRAIRWFDKPYTSDIHLPHAFRHSIGLPDHMLPSAWKRAQDTASSNNPQCDLLLAPSTIPNAGLGIFTRRELKIGDYIQDLNPAIPLLELDLHHERKGEGDDYSDRTANYVWDGLSMGMGNETLSELVTTYWPGINCAVNCNPALNNLEVSTPIYDEAGLHRSVHPGAGAFSPYHLGMSRAMRYVPAGGELFKDYGDDYFTTRDDYDGIPVTSDFAFAHEILKTFFGLKLGKSKKRRVLLYDFIIKLRGTWTSSRTLNALPDKFLKARAARRGDIADLHQPNAVRAPSWLLENGRCLDQIVPRKSTIENAGHGAFAKRFLPAGTIISGSPLHHPLQSFFDMYEEAETTDETEANEHPAYNHFSNKVGQQLFLNYCYGHEETSLRLCPYGSGVNYINHNQTLANVKIQWTPEGTLGHQSSWFSKSPAALDSYNNPGLAFDYIASRDILQGEELFLDYGDEWEAAWLKHSLLWEPEDDWFTYESAASWNKKFINEPLRTVMEMVEDPYPDNLSLRCSSVLADSAMMLREGVDIANLAFYWPSDQYGVVCYVVERNIDEDGHFRYDVLVECEGCSETNDVFVPGLPRHAFKFFDRPGTTDMHLRKAFRHAIGIPDEMIPDVWRDLSPDRYKEGETSRQTARESEQQAHEEL